MDGEDLFLGCLVRVLRGVFSCDVVLGQSVRCLSHEVALRRGILGL